MRRKELAAAPKAVDRRGLVLIAFALCLHFLGARCFLPRLSLLAFIILLWAIPFYFFGWAFARKLLFPVSYLLFCMPLSFLDSIASHLRLFMSSMSTSVLNGFGIESYQNGTIIYSTVAGGFYLNIADSCSGLRSFLALMSLTTAYAFVRLNKRWQQWALFALAVPIAVLGNMIRIVTIGFVALLFGQEIAVTIYHDWSGYLVFVAAVGLVFGCERLLLTDFSKWVNQWKKMSSKPVTS
jgi:exosortase